MSCKDQTSFPQILHICRYLPKITQPFHFNCNKKLSEGSHFIRGAKLPSDQQNNIPSNIQQSFLYSLTQFLVGIKKLNHKWQILSQQHHFGKIFLIRVHVCYVKLGRKRPDFEKTKSAPGQGAGTRTLYPPLARYNYLCIRLLPNICTTIVHQGCQFLGDFHSMGIRESGICLFYSLSKR